MIYIYRPFIKRLSAKFSVSASRITVDEVFPKAIEFAKFDRLPYLPHRVKEESEIMVCQQNTRYHFFGLIEMPKISPRISFANRTQAF